MAQMILGTTIGGFTALHSGLTAAAITGGGLSLNGNLSLPNTSGVVATGGAALKSSSTGVTWGVYAGSAGSSIFIGYDSTSTQRFIFNSTGQLGIGGTPTEALDVTGNIKLSGYVKMGTYQDWATASAPTNVNGRIYFNGTKLLIGDGSVWNQLGGVDPTQAITWTGVQTFNTKILLNMANSRFVLPLGQDYYAV